MSNNSKTTIKINDVTLKASVVHSPKEKAQGLMNISNLPKDEGMLFCYPRERILSFWMKSTNIPLSIAFINKKKEITQIEDLKPRDESSVESEQPSKWALETNRSWFSDNNIDIGDRLDFNSGLVNVKIVKLPPEAKKLQKKIEDALVNMTLKALDTKLSTNGDLSKLNLDIEVK